jgi:hypothetical protein
MCFRDNGHLCIVSLKLWMHPCLLVNVSYQLLCHICVVGLSYGVVHLLTRYFFI